MATSFQSNPVYYSVSSLTTGQNPPSRTVVLHRRSNHNGFGVYLGEDVPSGLYVVTVERNSPAADANIQPGDRVLAVNGQLVSTMSENPKEKVVKAASNSESLTLTIQSTDIFETLNIPLTNSYSDKNKDNKQQFLSKQTSNINVDLESYIRSLFANENVQILPSSSSTNNNEFIITTTPSGTSSTDFNSFPTRYPYTDDRKQDRQRRRRRRQPKQPLVETKGTQTTPNDDDEDTNTPQGQQQTSPSRPYPSHPTMGTPVRILRTNQSNPTNELQEAKSLPSNKFSRSPASDDRPNTSPTKPTPLPVTTAAVFAAAPSPTSGNKSRNSADTTHPPSQHMIDVVGAAVAASRDREQPNNRDQPSSRGSAPVTKRTTTPPPSRQPPGNNSRESAPVNKRATTPPRSQNPPPYTTVVNTDQGSYNVRNAQENRALASTESTASNIPSSNRAEGLHEVHLHRSPEFQGFGFHLQYNKSYYLVHRVEEGSPAEEAGLRANDVIHKINQQSTDKMPHGLFVQIVNATSDISFLVQHVDEYLRSNPVPPRNPQAAAAVSTAINDEGNKRKSGNVSKALGKLSSR